jgi:uncharacterized integral membrane protein
LLRRLVAAVILVPLAIIIIAFAVANRQTVTVSFDPFSPHEPVASVALPLFVLIILALIIGVIIGGVASWLGQGKWRGAARRFERELHRLRERVHAVEGAAAKPTTGPVAGEPPQRLRLRPPVR